LREEESIYQRKTPEREREKWRATKKEGRRLRKTTSALHKLSCAAGRVVRAKTAMLCLIGMPGERASVETIRTKQNSGKK